MTLLLLAALFFASSCTSSDSGGSGDDDSTSTTDPSDDIGGGQVVENATFSISGAKTLQALDTTVTAATSSSIAKSSYVGDRPVFQYKIVNEGLTSEDIQQRRLQAASGVPMIGETGTGGTNLLAVDDQGIASLAIDSQYMIKVMYSVVDPAGEYVYLALDTGWNNYDGNDYSQFIFAENCALFKVHISDNTTVCVKEGLFVQDMSDTYRQMISGNQKPIQFDEAGDVYFAGTTFSSDTWDWSWDPVIYKYTVSAGTVEAVTQDNQSVTTFLVLPTGEIAFEAYDTASYKSQLYIYSQIGGLIPLTSGNWGVDFFTTDSYNTVIWGEGSWESKGMYLARPMNDGTGRVESAQLDTRLFGSTESNQSSPRRVIVADDGNIYGVFESWLNEYNESTDTWDYSTVLSVYQILPYDGIPKVQLTLDSTDGWWAWMQETPFRISKGFLYFVEEYDPGDGYGTREVIKMVNLNNRVITTLLSTNRYEVYNWSVNNDNLYFAGLDQASNIVITGTIDTLKVKNGEPESTYLTIRNTASALGATASVQDISVLIPQQPEQDTGSAPSATVYYSAENLYSNTIAFTKYMNKSSAESNLTYRNSSSANISVLKLWVYKTLHLVPDLDGLLDMSWTTPLENDETYTIALESGVYDAFGWQLNPLSQSFTTKPDNGWWQGDTDDTGSFSSGKAGKYAGPETMYQTQTYDLGFLNLSSANIRVEFSARNYAYGNLRIVYWNRDRYTNNSNSNYSGIEAQVYLNSWPYLDYHTESSSNEWLSGDYVPKVMSGSWMKYRVDFYDKNIKTYYSEDGNTWTEITSLTVSDFKDRDTLASDDDDVTILLRLDEAIAIDNLKVSTLTSSGAIDSAESDLMNEDFEGSMPTWLQTDVNDTLGFY